MAVAVSAQSSDDYHKFEAGGNYSFQRIEKSGDFNNKTGFNGFEASATVNFSRYLGVKFDVSGAYKKDSFSFIPLTGPQKPISTTVKSSVYNFLGGIQIKDNSKDKKIKPFAHFLVGVGNIKQKLTGGECPNDVQSICNNYNFSKTGFAAAVGGGLDVKVSNRLSIRAIQADYNPIQLGERKAGNTTLSNGQTSNNFRLGAGIIFH